MQSQMFANICLEMHCLGHIGCDAKKSVSGYRDLRFNPRLQHCPYVLEQNTIHIASRNSLANVY